MFPIAFDVIRGAAFPNNWDIPIGTLFQLLSPGDAERTPGIEPATPFASLLNPLIPPLFGIPNAHVLYYYEITTKQSLRNIYIKKKMFFIEVLKPYAPERGQQV